MSVPLDTAHPQISLAYMPPTLRQRRSALVGAAVLLLGLAVLLPFAATPLPKVDGFITALDAIISVTDLITACLLLVHFSITRSRALWALGCGYLFSAAVVVAHGLTFPGVISPTGNLGGSLHTNFRIYLLWHLGLPVALFAYVWLRGKNSTKAGVQTTSEIVATCGGVAVLALVSCIAWLALLPPVDPVAGRWLTLITMSICAAALSVLWVFQRSALDQWLMVVMLAMIVELAITALVGGRGPSSGSLGFYPGRLFSLVTSTVVLTALLAETTRLYAGVARANMLASIVNAARALSSEIELPKLIERLMKIAIEYAGANRGLLVLPSGDEYLIQAEAQATGDQIEITICQEPITRILCPESLVRHVIRTRQSVILDDASKPNLFSTDDYLRDRQSKSILCLPLIKQAQLTGILFLENTLTSHAFTPERIAVLELLAAQAAISLENTRLYTDLQLQVGVLQHLPVSAWTLKPDGTPDFVNQVWLEFSGQTLDFVRSHPEAWMTAVHPDDREIAAKSFWEGVHSGQGFAMETRSLRARDGTYRWHLQQAVVLRDSDGKVLKFVGTTTDIDDQKRAEEALRQVQAELAHAARVTTMGELTASMAHEINQPLSGIITNAGTCLRMLAADPPNIDGARETALRTIRDGNRASDVIKRLRSLFAKKAPTIELVDLNEATREVIALSRSELQKNQVILSPEFADGLPTIAGDRVQLQQVILNLLLNAAEAMRSIDNRPRKLVVRTESDQDDHVRLSVEDAGVGLGPQSANKLFEPFYTTKSGGMGIGLSVSRSIIENHNGRIWAAPNNGPGATFSFSLPHKR